MQIKLGYHKWLHIELYCTFFSGYALWLFFHTHFIFISIFFLLSFFCCWRRGLEKKICSYICEGNQMNACDCTHAHNVRVNKPWRKDICCFLNFKTTRQTFNFCSIRRCYAEGKKEKNWILWHWNSFTFLTSCLGVMLALVVFVMK